MYFFLTFYETTLIRHNTVLIRAVNSLCLFVHFLSVFAIEREQAGLRRICGYGVSMTRGAASAMMFTYASLLVTMCRNIITFLRDTFLHVYIPFDDAVSMHKYIAFLAAVFTRQYHRPLTSVLFQPCTGRGNRTNCAIGRSKYTFYPTNISQLHIVNRQRSLPPDGIF